ncbi:hypothetical protein [Halorhabdus salina]|uniref:hypothetical protein n=1 Tax=Halorhabdus salina TaxID=2750670 RepID=UPI0015EE5359|nr:hypothetical protein [Halorhabdus salina]
MPKLNVDVDGEDAVTYLDEIGDGPLDPSDVLAKPVRGQVFAVLLSIVMAGVGAYMTVQSGLMWLLVAGFGVAMTYATGDELYCMLDADHDCYTCKQEMDRWRAGEADEEHDADRGEDADFKDSLLDRDGLSLFETAGGDQ